MRYGSFLLWLNDSPRYGDSTPNVKICQTNLRMPDQPDDRTGANWMQKNYPQSIRKALHESASLSLAKSSEKTFPSAEASVRHAKAGILERGLKTRYFAVEQRIRQCIPDSPWASASDGWRASTRRKEDTTVITRLDPAISARSLIRLCLWRTTIGRRTRGMHLGPETPGTKVKTATE